MTTLRFSAMDLLTAAGVPAALAVEEEEEEEAVVSCLEDIVAFVPEGSSAASVGSGGLADNFGEVFVFVCLGNVHLQLAGERLRSWGRYWL